MKKKLFVLLMALLMVMTMMPTTAFAANGTGHQISVKIYKVVLDSSKPLGYQNPELIMNKTVTCQDSTGHSGYNHSVNLKEFYPTAVSAPTKDWTGWEFASFYTKGNEQTTFYDWTSRRVDATANVTGSEPYPCSKNFYLVYKDSNPTPPPTPPKPVAPTYAKMKDLLANGAVKIDCVNQNESHADKTYSLIENSYTGGIVEGDATTGYTATITINPEKYVTEYNGYIAGHSLVEDQPAKRIVFKYENKAWKVNPTVPVTFKVKCESEPQPPTPTVPNPPSAEDVKTLLENAVVKVHCTNTNVNHADETYGLLDGSFTVGEEVQGSAETGYTVEVTIQAEEYVAKYNEGYTGKETHAIAEGVTNP